MNKTISAVVLLAVLWLHAGASFAAPSIDVGFSPEGSALKVVLRTIDDAHDSIRLMGYSFTSPEVVKSLVAAKKRGVDVRVVIDDKGNRSKASQAAMNVVVNAGIPLRINGQFRIMHDKVIITDGKNVETGSFNYTRSAAEYNSENALLISDVPALAQNYLTHWQSRWEGGTDWRSSY
ncbi:phospholipase D family protein (plasmid) [Pantoea allii]|uniref:phospholipase D family nuclease n=1 Tax=Pantoea TaxID=53335 RepID=UPI000B5A41C3|nr:MULTISPECIES: phospholipase D family protein [Pantoea]MCV3301124.1 phospholipase D family protein [Pantoea ananatis]OWY74660.1 phospholipase D family protein [Pantoea sp. AMG 501]